MSAPNRKRVDTPFDKGPGFADDPFGGIRTSDVEQSAAAPGTQAPELPQEPESSVPTRRRPWRILWILIGGLVGSFLVSILTGRVLHQTVLDQSGPAPGPGEFSDHGISFSYSRLHHLTPSELKDFNATPLSPGLPTLESSPWYEVFSLDDVNLATVSSDRLPLVVDERNVAAWGRGLEEEITEYGGVMRSTRSLTVAGLPAFQGTSTELRTPSGARLENRVTEVFTGLTGYVFTCQYSLEEREEMLRQCDQMLSSLSVQPSSDFSSAGWSTLRSASGSVSIAVPPGWQETSPPPKHIAIMATFTPPGESDWVARAFVVTTRRLPARVSSNDFASSAVAQVGEEWTVAERAQVTLPAGRAEMVRLSGPRAENLVYYFVVTGRFGYGLGFVAEPGEDDLELWKPTMERVAESITA